MTFAEFRQLCIDFHLLPPKTVIYRWPDGARVRQCKVCGEWKELKAMLPDNSSDGYSDHCCACVRADTMRQFPGVFDKEVE